MKISKNTSAFSRYFSARFKPFTKPVFWGSLGGILIFGVAIYQYWQHPEWIQTNSESISNSPARDSEEIADVSREDLAAAANLDNVDLLIEEMEQNRTLANIAAENNLKKTNSSELKQEDSEFSRFQKAQQAKLNDPSKRDSAIGSNSNLGIGDGNQKIMELLQPPSFSSYQSSRNSQSSSFKGTTIPQADIIPNPVGNIYLSNRNNQLPPPPSNPVAPNSTNSTSSTDLEQTNNNVATENNSSVENTNSNGGVVSTPNGQTSQFNNQPVTENSLPTRFVPSSSLTQSQSVYGTATTNPAVPSATGLNSFNPYAPNNEDGVPVNGAGTYPNGFNSVNSGSVGTPTQGVQNPLPGANPSFNSVGQESVPATEESNNPNSLQSNYRSFRTVSPSYNRTTPTGYQLQPQGYSLNGVGQSSGIYGANSVNSGGVSNNNTNPSATTNSPVTNNFGTPSLQPSGVLSTSEVGR